jgi:hypothetical protein
MLELAASTARRWISPFPRYTRGQPYGRWVLLSTCGEEDAMTAALTRPVQQRVGQFARLWWLPAGGYGNGLGDSSWVPALEISSQVVPQLLGALRDAGVPGYAAPARLATWLREQSERPAGWQLWVGASGYGRAESTLLAAMPSLAREAADRADSAWR